MDKRLFILLCFVSFSLVIAGGQAQVSSKFFFIKVDVTLCGTCIHSRILVKNLFVLAHTMQKRTNEDVFFFKYLNMLLTICFRGCIQG